MVRCLRFAECPEKCKIIIQVLSLRIEPASSFFRSDDLNDEFTATEVASAHES